MVSLPSQWTTLGPEIPVWLHLHGAPAVVEANFASIGAPGVLVNLTLPGLSKVYADHFADPEVFSRLLRDVEAALRAESSARPWRAGRVTVSSFSAGFGGVRALLRQPEAFDRIAALVMADSIYCGYAGDAAERRVDPELMAGFLRFAQLAAEGGKRLVISHSSQVPVGYASTTETADYLIQEVGGARSFEPEEWPGGLKLASSYGRGQLDIFGFDGEGPDDHMRHLRTIGALLDRARPIPALQPAASLADLRAQIEAHVTQPRFSAAAWGVKVSSLDSGRTLYEHHADRLLSPASNSKLYVGALALDQLGADYRFVTPLLATAKPDGAGELRGDVIVSGRGDPSWSSRTSHKDFWKIFAPFAEVLTRAGIRQITGDIVADATFFQSLPNGAGWTADDLEDYYGAEISALTLEDNYAELRIAPGLRVGEPCELGLLLPHTGLVLDNRTVTSAGGGRRHITTRRIFGENILHVFGEVPLGGKEEKVDVTMPRPANWFAAALKDALGRRGIRVDGQGRGVRWPDPTVVTPQCIPLGEITSPPLGELIAALMKPSQNLETDLIFAHLGEKTRQPDTPSWRTSDQLALAALRDFLQRNGLPADEVRFDEGSGLSRNNLTTANATTRLLEFMATHRESGAFMNALPIAAVDGTLKRRMKGTPAEGNMRAKTGSLRWANSLSGYVTSAGGERLAFSLMLNRAVQPPGRSAREDLDAIALVLANYAGAAGARATAVPAPGAAGR